jgi:hypothetical protein
LVSSCAQSNLVAKSANRPERSALPPCDKNRAASTPAAASRYGQVVAKIKRRMSPAQKHTVEDLCGSFAAYRNLSPLFSQENATTTSKAIRFHQNMKRSNANGEGSLWEDWYGQDLCGQDLSGQDLRKGLEPHKLALSVSVKDNARDRSMNHRNDDELMTFSC